MNITIIGTGYVGLVSAACFADLGHTVIGMDIDEEKIERLKQGIIPIYEPGLEEIVERNLQNGRLSFTTDLPSVLNQSQVVFSAVGTPPKEDFSADLRTVFAVCETVAKHAEKNLIFVNKSTVPVGTGVKCEERIKTILQERGLDINIPVISNPEFLREGCAVSDTLHPDRIVVGINNNEWAVETINELYAPLTRTSKPVVHMNRESAELVKYASNAFLANKISFINMISEFCEVVGANVNDVAQGMGLDDRIGSRFLQAGIGFGGSCFPKDVKALMAMSNEFNVPMSLVTATHEINLHQRERFFQKLHQALPANATVAVWGLSFKPQTDDMREAPSVDLIPELIRRGHKVVAFDPVAMEVAKTHWLPAETHYCSNAQVAATDADAVILLTEWDDFKGIDLSHIQSVMKGNLFFDGRNVYDPETAREAGLEYTGVGI